MAMHAAVLSVSIIICTKDRIDSLMACLASVVTALDRASPLAAEIIVIDNNSQDDTAEQVTRFSQNCPYPVILGKERKRGQAAARNSGMRLSKGDILIFTDDDCRLSQDHITQALAHFMTDKEPVLRGGRVSLGHPEDIPLTVQLCPHIIQWHIHIKGWSHLGGGVIPGCNMAMPRTLIERVGFFDERMGAGTNIPAGEDSDYILRAYQNGFLIEYVPDMEVAHHHGRKTLEEGRRLIKNYAIAAGAVLMKHGLRHPNIVRKYFTKSVPRAIKGESANKTDPRIQQLRAMRKKARPYYFLGMARYAIKRFFVPAN